MAESIFLQMPRTPGPFHWLLVDALGNRIGHVQQGALSEAAAQARGRKLTAFVPGEQVLLFPAEIPTRNLQKVQQAAPFILEDKLAADVETLHFSAELRDTGKPLVAVTEQDRMRHWLDEMAQAGLEPVQLVADVTALPPPPEGAVVALDAGYAVVRFADGSGFTTERELALDVLRRRLAERESDAPPLQIALHAGEADDGAGFAAALIGAEVIQHPMQEGLLPLLAANQRKQRGLNLLQGAFQIRTGFQEHWRIWRVAIVLLAVCLLLGLVQQGVSYVRLKREAGALDAQVTQLFNQAMPGSRQVAGAEKQRMQSLLAQLQGGGNAGSLLSLLSDLGGAMAANPSIQVIAVDYHNGTLDAQLQASDVGALDALKAGLSRQNGLSVTLDSVSAAGSQVTGRIALSGGAS